MKIASVADVKARLTDNGKLLRKLKSPRLVVARQSVHGILQLWPSLGDYE